MLCAFASPNGRLYGPRPLGIAILVRLTAPLPVPNPLFRLQPRLPALQRLGKLIPSDRLAKFRDLLRIDLPGPGQKLLYLRGKTGCLLLHPAGTHRACSRSHAPLYRRSQACRNPQAPSRRQGARPPQTGAQDPQGVADGTRKSSGAGEDSHRKQAKGNVLLNLACNPTRRKHAGRIGIHQDLHHNSRLARRVPTAVAGARRSKRARVQASTRSLT